MNRPELVDTVIQSLESQREESMVIVSKVEPAQLRYGFIPLKKGWYKDWYQVVDYVRTNFVIIKETRFFELYQ